MSDHELPPVNFTQEELTYLQDLITNDRAAWFNYYEELIMNDEKEKAKDAFKEYEMCKNLRTKLYHLNGRDTLAVGQHQQRWWDQQHDYN